MNKLLNLILVRKSYGIILLRILYYYWEVNAQGF